MKICVLVHVGLIITLIPFYQSNAQDWRPPEPVCPGNLQAIIAVEGELIPFAGQLLTNDAAACIAGQITTCVEFANAEMDHREEVYEANLELVTNDSMVQIESRDDIIDLLEDELADALDTPWYDSFAFQFTLGIGAGVVFGYFLHDVIN